ncbi:uncharacterized protein FFB20_15161 [Fusarium fujikuroi]|nr:uncharacterized protein FFE2_01645 [Fusarium fujikuroi]SCN72911.1 uncharacterized protein FFC1_01638 [Fusarium fujikuroi]SCO17153.1 uncharacterized protein FFB20_15161 [Fusarium fujikuroi]SCO26905.1 uncharacterized protein FFM5_15174 [Fusarium fujikuroi]SCO27711.1 uncharacterized protein FFMR_00591 [Fusarium fujikuroi]
MASELGLSPSHDLQEISERRET